jgi:hypothetical protein
MVVLMPQLAPAIDAAGGRGPGDDARVGGPALNSYRFHILNGVLNAIAHPLG